MKPLSKTLETIALGQTRVLYVKICPMTAQGSGPWPTQNSLCANPKILMRSLYVFWQGSKVVSKVVSQDKPFPPK